MKGRGALRKFEFKKKIESTYHLASRFAKSLWKRLSNRRALVFLGAIVPAAAWVAAITADDNPAMSIFAGVIVGAVVTAVASWVIGPEVERQVRKQTMRDAALAEMVQLLFSIQGTTFDLTSDIFVNNSAVKARLDELSSKANELSLLGLRTRDPGLVQACWEWRSLCLTAGLSILSLPPTVEAGQAAPDDAEGMVPMTLILGGVLGGVDDLEPLEHEAYRLCERVGTDCRALLRRVLEMSEMDIPAFLQPGGDNQRKDIGLGERKIMTDVLHSVFRSIAANSWAAESLGVALLESSRHSADLGREMDQLEADCLADVEVEERPRVIGEVVLTHCATEKGERTYPRLVIEAMSLLIGVNTVEALA